MSIHEPNDRGLTPEERALSERLARLGPQAEPSPTLDARILAAAHAAAQDSLRPAPDPIRPASRRPRRRKVARWPTVFGFAASLALAFGIAWQLRPPPTAPVAAQAPSEGDDALAEFQKAPPPAMSMRTVPPKRLEVPAPPPAEPEARPRRRATVREATPDDMREKPQAFETAPFVLDEALPAHPAAAAPAAPPAPVAADDAAAAAGSAPAAPMQRAAQVPAAKAAANSVEALESTTTLTAEQITRQQRAADAEPEFAEADEEVVPPATADSPEVRDAWLRRIRELQRAGKIDDARASLQAFRQRYPHQAIPDDLRALEE